MFYYHHKSCFSLRACKHLVSTTFLWIAAWLLWCSVYECLKPSVSTVYHSALWFITGYSRLITPKLSGLLWVSEDTLTRWFWFTRLFLAWFPFIYGLFYNKPIAIMPDILVTSINWMFPKFGLNWGKEHLSGLIFSTLNLLAIVHLRPFSWRRSWMHLHTFFCRTMIFLSLTSSMSFKSLISPVSVLFSSVRSCNCLVFLVRNCSFSSSRTRRAST